MWLSPRVGAGLGRRETSDSDACLCRVCVRLASSLRMWPAGAECIVNYPLRTGCFSLLSRRKEDGRGERTVQPCVAAGAEQASSAQQPRYIFFAEMYDASVQGCFLGNCLPQESKCVVLTNNSAQTCCACSPQSAPRLQRCFLGNCLPKESKCGCAHKHLCSDMLRAMGADHQRPCTYVFTNTSAQA